MHDPGYPRRRRAAAPARPDGQQTDNTRSGRQKRAIATIDSLWAPGSVLRVSFIGKTHWRLKRAIFKTALEWITLSGANLSLSRAPDNDPGAQIRILTSRHLPYNESAVGTAALTEPGETMSLNVRPRDAAFRQTVLHEFGHALGLEHEHQHPDANIPWDVPEVLRIVAATQGWSDAEIMEEMINRRSDTGLLKVAYDPTSVMHYPIQQALTLGDWEVGDNNQLSNKDLMLIRLAYPH